MKQRYKCLFISPQVDVLLLLHVNLVFFSVSSLVSSPVGKWLWTALFGRRVVATPIVLGAGAQEEVEDDPRVVLDRAIRRSLPTHFYLALTTVGCVFHFLNG